MSDADPRPIADALGPVIAPNTSHRAYATGLRDGARALFAGLFPGFTLAAIGSQVAPYAGMALLWALDQINVRLGGLAASDARFWHAFFYASLGAAAGILAKMWREGRRPGLPTPPRDGTTPTDAAPALPASRAA